MENQYGMYKVRDKYPVRESILRAVDVFFVFCIFLFVFPILNKDVDGNKTVPFQQTFTPVVSNGVAVWHLQVNIYPL